MAEKTAHHVTVTQRKQAVETELQCASNTRAFAWRLRTILSFHFLKMCMSVRMYVSLCTTYVPDAHRGQKRVMDPLKLEL